MRRAVLAGVETIEHGDGGTREVFRLMRRRGVALCPTLAAAEAYAQYFEGWKRGVTAGAPSVIDKRASFRAALDEGVPSASAATWECSATETTSGSSRRWSPEA